MAGRLHSEAAPGPIRHPGRRAACPPCHPGRRAACPPCHPGRRALLSPRTARERSPTVTPDGAKRRSGVQPARTLPGFDGGAGPRLGGRGDKLRRGRGDNSADAGAPPCRPGWRALLSPRTARERSPTVTPDGAKRRSGVQPARTLPGFDGGAGPRLGGRGDKLRRGRGDKLRRGRGDNSVDAGAPPCRPGRGCGATIEGPRP